MQSRIRNRQSSGPPIAVAVAAAIECSFSSCRKYVYLDFPFIFLHTHTHTIRLVQFTILCKHTQCTYCDCHGSQTLTCTHHTFTRCVARVTILCGVILNPNNKNDFVWHNSNKKNNKVEQNLLIEHTKKVVAKSTAATVIAHNIYKKKLQLHGPCGSEVVRRANREFEYESQ